MVAYVVDLILLWLIHWVVAKLVVVVIGFVSTALAQYAGFWFQVILWYVLVYFYFGIFYSERGASPGKMLMGLAVRDEETGARLTPGRAFFREAIGKFISAVPMCVGYFVALFRDDGRTLHDLLFDTRVVRNITSSRIGNPN